MYAITIGVSALPPIAVLAVLALSVRDYLWRNARSNWRR